MVYHMSQMFYEWMIEQMKPICGYLTLRGRVAGSDYVKKKVTFLLYFDSLEFVIWHNKGNADEKWTIYFSHLQNWLTAALIWLK